MGGRREVELLSPFVGQSRFGKKVEIVQDVAVRVKKAADIEQLTEPLCPAPEVRVRSVSWGRTSQKSRSLQESPSDSYRSGRNRSSSASPTCSNSARSSRGSRPSHPLSQSAPTTKASSSESNRVEVVAQKRVHGFSGDWGSSSSCRVGKKMLIRVFTSPSTTTQIPRRGGRSQRRDGMAQLETSSIRR